MPEAQLTEPLDHAAEKGGVKETFAALEAAVEADVDAFLRRGSVNADAASRGVSPGTARPGTPPARGRHGGGPACAPRSPATCRRAPRPRGGSR